MDKIRNLKRQKAAAETILKLRGTVKFETTWLGIILRDDSLVRVTYVALSRTPITNSNLEQL